MKRPGSSSRSMAGQGDYKPLHPAELAYYDGVVSVDLSKIRPMIALPMHPSNAFPIEELNANLKDILHECEENVQQLVGRSDVKLDLCSKIENGRLRVDQGVIAGCAGGLFDSIYEAASILKGHTGGCGDYALSVYPGSQPIMMELNRTGVLTDLMASGATIRTAFCGPCFGAGDVPANGALSIRHTTRNFPSREGSKPGSGQLAGVAPMDARSIAATTANGGIPTPRNGGGLRPHRARIPLRPLPATRPGCIRALATAITMPCSSWAPTSRTGPRSPRWATTCC